MHISGFGDPTNGLGGISYVKYSLRAQRFDTLFTKLSQKEQQKTMGSKADLRGLNMERVHYLLKKYGNYSEEVLSKLERWDKIDFLRILANDLLHKKNKTAEEKQLIVYSRNSRMTTEKQQQKYIKEINSRFMRLINFLSNKKRELTPVYSQV